MKLEIYENLFLRKNQTDHVQTWFGRSGEGRSNLRQCGTKKWLSPFVENYYSNPQYEFRNQTVKLASRWVLSLASWIAGTYFKQVEASQEIKVKLNESQRLKFYQVKQLKENSTKNSAEKNFKEDSKLNDLWNISTKKKKKWKILKFNELCFPDTLR